MILKWITFRSWLKKAWAWSKKNWQLFVGAAVPLLIMILSRKGFDLTNVLKRINDDYHKEIESIEEARKKEIADRDKSIHKYFSTIEEIEAEYKARKEELDSEKREHIENILEEYDGDPDEITRRIASITGFKIYTQ